MLWVFAFLQLAVVVILRVLWWTAVLLLWLAASIAGAVAGATQRAWRQRRRRPREVTW